MDRSLTSHGLVCLDEAAQEADVAQVDAALVHLGAHGDHQVDLARLQLRGVLVHLTLGHTGKIAECMVTRTDMQHTGGTHNLYEHLRGLENARVVLLGALESPAQVHRCKVGIAASDSQKQRRTIGSAHPGSAAQGPAPNATAQCRNNGSVPERT